jgi:hypothetical protein
MRTIDYTIIVPVTDDPDLAACALGDRQWDHDAMLAEEEFRRLMSSDTSFRRMMHRARAAVDRELAH